MRRGAAIHRGREERRLRGRGDEPEASSARGERANGVGTAALVADLARAEAFSSIRAHLWFYVTMHDAPAVTMGEHESTLAKDLANQGLVWLRPLV